MKIFYLLIGLLVSNYGFSQSLNNKLQQALTLMMADEQFRHAIVSLYVADKTGNFVFEKNSEIGLAPASTQKIITSVTAFEILGKNYRYKTIISGGPVVNGVLKGGLYFTGSGDPTLGSWRWESTRPQNVFKYIFQLVNEKKISEISGGIYIDDSKFAYPPIPDGWIWQDIGNYYGAGAWGLNWHENQYDLHLKSGETIGSPVTIKSTSPVKLDDKIKNYITSAKKGKW